MRTRSRLHNAGRIRIGQLRRPALALLALFAIVVGVPLAAAAPVDASTSRWAWTSSERVPHYDAAVAGGLTCPTSKLCVAANDNRVLWSTNPKVAKSWTSAALEPKTSPYLIGGDVALEAVDCASAHFCAAVDDVGKIFMTTDPKAGAASWSATPLDGDTDAELLAVSCATATTCAVLSDTGAAFTLTPGGWQREQLISSHNGTAFSSVSCASATLCAAVEADDNIYTIDPSVGGAWKRTKVGAKHVDGWISIDCPSATTCVAVGNYRGSGVVAVSRSLAKSTWTATRFAGAVGGFNLVACKSATFCVLAGGPNYWSTKPSSASSWHSFAPQSANSQVEAACLTAKVCLVGDVSGKLRIGHRR